MTEGPPVTPPAPSELPKTWRRVYAIWWAMMWRMILGLLLFTALVVFLTEKFLLNYPYLRMVINNFSLLVLLPLGIWALRVVINRNFQDFRLALLPRPVEAEAKEDAAAQQEEPQKIHTESDK